MIRTTSNLNGRPNRSAAIRYAQTKFREARRLPYSSLVRTRSVTSAPRRRPRLDPTEFRPTVSLRDSRTSSLRRKESAV